ncbi:MAG TPA: response regulator transcription factor [Ignavibacteriaceae bacterium]|jgi:DNA-binding NarL/FixJ family response regulator
MDPGKKIQTIVIEDNSLFRKTLTGFINQSPELVCSRNFASCEDALETMERESIDPDIIFLDIGLPGMNGIEGISHLRNTAPSAKIIILTIRDDDETIFKAICSGASGYLLKDSTSEKILDSIKEVLNGGAPMNSSIAARVLKMFKEFVPAQGDYSLTKREKEILKLLVDGLSKNIIAEKLFLSYHTVDGHIRKIYEKLEVHSASGAVAKALKENLI